MLCCAILILFTSLLWKVQKHKELDLHIFKAVRGTIKITCFYLRTCFDFEKLTIKLQF